MDGGLAEARPVDELALGQLGVTVTEGIKYQHDLAQYRRVVPLSGPHRL
jgi:hypothetical protein